MLGPLFGGDGPYVWPSWGKKRTTKQANKKPVNNQMDWKLPKIKHITYKIKAWLSQETKLDVDTPSSYQFGKDVMQHRPASQMCKPSWVNPPARLLHPRLSNKLCLPSSWCRAASCCCWLSAARAGCVSPSPVWAKHCPGSLTNLGITQVLMHLSHPSADKKIYTCLSNTLKTKLGLLTTVIWFCLTKEWHFGLVFF